MNDEISCCIAQVDKEEREWCAGLPAEAFSPWVRRLVAQEHSPELAALLLVWYVECIR